MSGLRVLPAADRVATAWKNGGGVTREIAIHPYASGDAFEWRISVADVTRAGPFSHFYGIDRTLMVLSGELDLDLPDRRTRLAPGDSITFAGEAPVSGAPANGTVVDLNVMVRRDRWQAGVVTIMPPVGMVLRPRHAWGIALFAGPGHGQYEGRAFACVPGDAVQLGPDVEPMTIASAYPIYIVSLTRLVTTAA